MKKDAAKCEDLSNQLAELAAYLDRYLKFGHADAMQNVDQWQPALDQALPKQGVGIENVIHELGNIVIPNGSQIPNPASTAFITTGATNMGVLANLSALVAAPQRIGLHAFNYLEELSLEWLAELFALPTAMKGVYSSGGSVANLLALGAARQYAFENIGHDPAANGINKPVRIYATEASHHTVHRAAAVLGLGRESVFTIPSDDMGRMLTDQLEQQLLVDLKNNTLLPMAIVANAGTTGTGAIDPLEEIGAIANHHSIWFHIDGAYGLPGVLDSRVKPLYKGLERADSVIVDPHKWLGAPVGIGATFVRDRNILHRAFTQGSSDYLEGACDTDGAEHSMDQLGIPYHDFGVELSAPSRGVVVWALLREIGKQGLTDRIVRHNNMARELAKQVEAHPELELVQAPTLSITCFRYNDGSNNDLNTLNKQIHRQLVRNGNNMPSTVQVNGKFAIRPCFVGARTSWPQVDSLINEVIMIGRQLKEQHNQHTTGL